MSFQSEIATTQSSLSQVTQRFQFEQQRAQQIELRLAEIETDKAELVKAVALIDKAIAHISANGISKIESIVTGGMQLAFDDPTLGFRVVKSEAERGSKYRLEGVRGEVQGPFLDTFGGGVWNVVGFLLRVIMVKRFKLGKVLVLDEAFNNVAARFQPQVSALLKSLTRDHGFTILAITHQPLLVAQADNIYRIVPEKGKPPRLLKISKTDLGEVFPPEE